MYEETDQMKKSYPPSISPIIYIKRHLDCLGESDIPKSQHALTGMLAAVSTILEICTYYLIYKILNEENGEFLTNEYINIDPPIIGILFLIISASVRIFALKKSANVTYECGKNIALRMYKSIINQSYTNYRNTEFSQVNSKFQAIDTIAYNYYHQIFNLISAFVVLITLFTIFIYVSATITLTLSLCLSILFTASIFTLKRKTKLNSKYIIDSQERRSNILINSFYGFREILINGNSPRDETYFIEIEDNLKKSRSENIFYGLTPRIIIELSILTVPLIALSMVGKEEIGELDLSLISIFLIVFIRMLTQFNTIYTSLLSIMSYLPSTENLFEYIKSNEQSKYFIENISLQMKGIHYEINDYLLPNGKYLFRKKSIEIKKGENIAIIGESGSGKSTLLDILLGFHPESCLIRLIVSDNDITNIRPQNIRNLFSFVPQSPHIVAGSVLENLSYPSCEGFHTAEITQVMRICKIQEGTGQFPSLIQENGTNLSGGQRQKISIARALLKRRPFLIFDEATSAMDTESQEEILSAIIKQYPETTFISVTHRTETLKFFDRIISISDGIIMERINRV
jgi:ATP-binding cassette, subfamily B, bacterial PglK